VKPGNQLQWTSYFSYFLLQLLPPVRWNISNCHSKLNCTIVRLTGLIRDLAY